MGILKTIATAGLAAGLMALVVTLVTKSFQPVKPGQDPCTKGGWLVFFLPIILAIVFTAVTGIYAAGQAPDWNPNPYVQMVMFTVTLVILQYIVSTALIKQHTGVSWPEAFKAGIGAAMGALLPSIVAIVTYWVLTTFVPQALPVVGQRIWDLMQKIPFVKKLYTRQAHWLPAYGLGVGPLLGLIPIIGITFWILFSVVPWTPLGAFAGHGIACRATIK